MSDAQTANGAVRQPLNQSTDAERRRDALGLFRAVFEAVPHGVLVANDAGDILFANPLIESILLYAPGELVGRPISALVPASSLSEHTKAWTEFWENRRTRPMDLDQTLMGIRKDGMILPLEISLSVFVKDESRYVVASLTDATDRINLEARLAAASSEHLGFQRLVAQIAGRIGTVDPIDLDDAIVDGLRQLGEALQVDRALLWRMRTGEAITTTTHQWRRNPDSSLPEPYLMASIPYTVAKLEAGEAFGFANVDEVPDPIDRETFRQREEVLSGMAVPLPRVEPYGGDLRALSLSSTTQHITWSAPMIERLRLVAAVIGQALARASSQSALEQALTEVKQLRARTSAENVELRREVRGLRTPSAVVTESAAIKRVIAQIEQVAPTPATVLLLGETGTGKEVMAQAIHNLSPRHHRNMIRVSCAAIPTALVESELFGRERGAYTGALSRQIGRFEAANQSTLFLDEIGELPLEVQVKLLRVLQERVIERLGSTQSVKVDVRIIAATNRNLEDAVEQKTFREDLYYRLCVFPIVIPPLRERVEDIPGLVWSFIDEFARMFGKSIDSISKETMAELEHYSWPGNVRELRNVIERAVIVSTGRQLHVPTPRPPTRVPQTAMTLTELEIDHIRGVLNSTGWRVRGRGGAAERLGVKPTTLESRMARLGIMRKPT